MVRMDRYVYLIIGGLTFFFLILRWTIHLHILLHIHMVLIAIEMKILRCAVCTVCIEVSPTYLQF